MVRQLYFTLIVAVVMVATGCGPNDDSMNTEDTKVQQKEWAIVLHGGAGTISKSLPDSIKTAYRAALDSALTLGEELLREGTSAPDVVERVINYLEDNPKFNAGKGAVFTNEGGHELDAAIMIGNTRTAGAVAGVKTVKNPISLARKVMEQSKHVMLSGTGAEEFASTVGVERVNQDYFYTEKRYEAWKRAVEDENDTAAHAMTPGADSFYWLQRKYGTVGCVVLDQEGTLVAGTSTGGMTNKKYGRIGDVPIIGAGTYASDLVAVSMTGWGEKIMKAVSGSTVSNYMRFNDASLRKAGSYLLNDVLAPGDAGMIAVDRYGNTYMNMNTEGMFRGAADANGKHEVAIWD